MKGKESQLSLQASAVRGKRCGTGRAYELGEYNSAKDIGFLSRCVRESHAGNLYFITVFCIDFRDRNGKRQGSWRIGDACAPDATGTDCGESSKHMQDDHVNIAGF
jgi:hypothetical protein